MRAAPVALADDGRLVDTRAQSVGVKVTSNVSGLTVWLVAPAKNPMTTKSRAAAEKGTRIVTEQTFARMMTDLEADAHSPDT
jgi:NAD-dependent DNA ligase